MKEGKLGGWLDHVILPDEQMAEISISVGYKVRKISLESTYIV
jgi:hypothetical protein